MSYATFLASDTPMPELQNPHQQFLSVNEALAKGVDVPNLVLDTTAIDRDNPDAIMWFESEDSFGEIAIQNTEQPYHFTDDYGNPPETDLACFSELNWNYTEERATKLIGYIRKHLEKAVVVEIWHTWIGGGRDFSKGMKKHGIHIDELTTNHLEKLFSHDSSEYDCIVVGR